MKTTNVIPLEQIERRILLIQGQKVMVDRDLAELYGVSTKALNQAVKRNRERFPPDFMFQLTNREKGEVVTICDHLTTLKFSATLPHVFTEHGTVMLANVLKSRRAIQASILVVRAFIHLRHLVLSHQDLTRRLNNMEKKYDSQFKVVFDAIRRMMEPPKKKQRQIGFNASSMNVRQHECMPRTGLER